MNKLLILAISALAFSLQAATQITWKHQQLHGDFYSEGAAIGDINGDGKPDVVAGPFWWEGPAFEKKHAYYEPKIFSINGYSDNFFAYVHDFNADKRNDILILGFPGKEARLYLNVERTFQSVGSDETSSKTRSTYWPMHIVADVVDNESPVFTDITGDGKPEIVCSTGGKFGWFAPNWSKPTEKWPFVAVTDDMKVAKFTHGLGVGDVNGDGKLDLLEARRWWEQPKGWAYGNFDAGDRDAVNPIPFIQHNFAAGVGGGAQMFAYDFDGNGTNDVFTALAAHRYGVAVYLQNKVVQASGLPDAAGTAAPHWNRVMLASEQPQDNDYGIVFSQPHAAHLADIDGDGVQDIVTGKRYWAHNGHDPDERGHRVIYWYQTKRDGKGGVDFVPHLIDSNSGVGVDVQVGDVNGDKLPDIVVGNKAGVFILTQERKDTTADLTPKKLYGPALKPQTEYAKGQLPADALKSMQLPGGFKAELIAAEPDLVQPMAFTFDERGRIWVVEGNSYPQPREVGKGQDRIKILEDQDGDGTFETKKIFCEGLNLVSGIELGFGGVWVGAAPYLMFIPDLDHDDRADALNGTHGSHATYKTYASYSQVPGVNFTAYALLDGWGTQDTHETLNSFIWGPDGWLYGCHGVFTHSRVGKPGTPDDQREPINAGVWRYHPVRHEFEVFAHGTSNPWGLDYDQHGEWFVTACVIPHLYHIVPGGRYQRQAGQHFNAHTYEDIKTIADHAHYAGNPRPDVTFDKTTGAGVMNNDTNALGGGHAHCGLAIYQSSLFPPTYRNQLLFGNLHGHRLVANYTDPHASTYIGKHAADFLRANDMHFIPVTQKVGPDGALYVSDWSDQQICHRGSGAVEHWDRSNGRLYRISYDGWKPWKGDLAKESDEALAKLAVQTENEWESRMARRVLMERASDPDFKYEMAYGSKVNMLSNILDQMWKSVGSITTSGDQVIKSMQLVKAFGLDILAGGEFYSEFKQDQVRAMAVRWMTSDWSAAKPTRRFLTEEQMARERKEQAPSRLLPSIEDSKVPDKATYLRQQRGPTGPPATVESLDEFARAIASETAPLVRREFASLLQRLPENARSPVATALLKHGEDKDDPMIPLLIWYGIEPVVAADPAAGMQLAKVSKMPKATQFIYRRLAAEPEGRNTLLRALAGVSARPAPQPAKGGAQPAKGGAPIAKGGGPAATRKADSEAFSPAEKESILAAIVGAAKGAGKLTPPADWPAIAAGLRGGTSVAGRLGEAAATQASGTDALQMGMPRTLELVRELAALFGDAGALGEFRAVLADASKAAPQRQAALSLLIQTGDAATAPVLRQMLAATGSPAGLRRQMIQALASIKDTETPAFLGGLLPKLPANELPDAVNTLASTKEGAKALLKAVEAKAVPASALSPFLIRQLLAFDDAEITALIKSAWGDVNAPKADLAVRTKKYRDLLTPAALAKGDAAKGKLLYMGTCGACHKLLGEGQNVGPDITGSNRADLNYLLENVLDPNAVIGKDYQLQLFTMTDGRVMGGVVKEESAAAVKVAMMGGIEFTLAKADVKKREVSKLSTMPEGLFDALQPEMVVDLVKYLQSGNAERTSKFVQPGKTNLEVRSTPGALEGESLKVIEITGGNARKQGMGGFGSEWSGGAQLWWTGGKPDQKLTLAIPVKEAGKHALHGALTMARDYGVTSITLDGRPVASSFDGFNAAKVIHTGELDWGTHELAAGEHRLTFTLAPPNPDAKPGNMVGLDYVRLEKK